MITPFFPAILAWWIPLFGLGLVVYPISFLLFSRFWDRGWGLTKVVAVLLVSYWVWLIGSLKLLPFESLAIWLGIVLVGSLSFLVWSGRGGQVIGFIKRHWQLLVFEEILFTAGLVSWFWVRAHQPDINGLEKFMDFGFVNSILRSRFFPPADIWLAGESINYYYFGHLVAAVLTKLSGLSSVVTYNLMLATISGFALSGTFSVAGTLMSSLMPTINKASVVPRFVAGLVSAVVLVFAGNLHTIVTILSRGTEGYWYPDATRLIPYTIHEFPLYSFVVADLHGHVNNIPFVLLMVGLLVSFLLDQGSLWYLALRKPAVLLRLLGMGLLLGVLYMTNAMDAIIYLAIIGLSLAGVGIKRRHVIKVLLSSGAAVALIAISGVILSLPFHLHFTPFTTGVGLVAARSRVSQLLVLWGFFLLVAAAYVAIFLISQRRRSGDSPRFDSTAQRFILVLLTAAFLFVLLPELIYFKDIYIAEYHRANTMFKFVYQTFILMSLMTGPALVATWMYAQSTTSKRLRVGMWVLVSLFLVGLGSVLIYPYFAIRSYYSNLHTYRDLRGDAWLKERYPADFAAIDWLRREIDDQPVILEAVGESYTDFARVSAYTGLPTILGWRVHEWLWRGSFDEPARRTEEVARLYSTATAAEACQILQRYTVQYILVGALEYRQYPSLNEYTFQTLGDLVFSQGDSRIYRIRYPCGGSFSSGPQPSVVP